MKTMPSMQINWKESSVARAWVTPADSQLLSRLGGDIYGIRPNRNSAVSGGSGVPLMCMYRLRMREEESGGDQDRLQATAP